MDVKLPHLGEGADSGVVVSLLVKEGETVQKDQTIIELENEKAIAPIPSPASGEVAQIRVKEGDKISVGQVILVLKESGELVKEEAPAPAPAKPVAVPQPSVQAIPQAAPAPLSAIPVYEPLETGIPPAAAPSVRKIARELGIDLARIKGSERGGRIIMKDLRDYIQYLQAMAFQVKQSLAAPAPAAAATPVKPPAESIDFSKWGPVHAEKVTPLRRTIANKMVESWTTLPHVTQYDESDITDLMALRKKYKEAYQQKGASLTLTPFILKAVVSTLKQHPIFNASWDEVKEEIVYKDYYHIGIAVDTEAGLIVPVLRDVDKKSLLELSVELEEIAAKARSRKVSLEDLKGGTFTISNQGGIGGGAFTPIINKPEVAILGIAKGAFKPRVRNKKIESRLVLPLSLSYDHRVIDGANAARFISDLVAAMESFTDKDVELGK